MNEETGNRIFDFLRDRGDFETGLALLATVMPNPYFILNLRRKGEPVGYESMVYELGKRCPEGIKGEGRRQEAEEGIKIKAEGKRQKAEEWEKGRKGEGEKRFVLRNEFPFLGEDNCPDELKLLVADMITAHTKYIDSHNQLYHVANKSNEQCFTAAESVVENYLNNRSIWAELEHFKKNGRILGEHGAFAKLNRKNEIEGMDSFELMKLYRNLPRSINYYTKLIKEDKDNEQAMIRKEKLIGLTHEYKVVKRLLQIHDGPGKKGSKKANTSGKG